jgi:arylsulfatase A-like enzyme
MFPKSWTEQGLTCEHVPLLFYAPKLLQPKRVHDIASQVDILPTAAALVKTPYVNNTLGRNLFDSTDIAPQYQPTVMQQRFAFIIDHDVKTIGLISDQYYFLKNLKTGTSDLVSMTNNNAVEKTAGTDSIRNYLNRLTNAWYETAQYLMLNNKKK